MSKVLGWRGRRTTEAARSRAARGAQAKGPLAPAAAKATPAKDARVDGLDLDEAGRYTSPQSHRQRVERLLKHPDVARLAKAGTAAENLFQIQQLLLDAVGVRRGDEVLQIVGDTEGRVEGNDWLTLRTQGIVVRDPDGSIRFASDDHAMKFAHLGDIAGDRGMRGFLDTYEVNQLRETTPHLSLIGNRENKILMHNDLPDLEALKGPLAEPYRAYLAKNWYPNTFARRLQFWLAEVGAAPQALENHKAALYDVLVLHQRGELNDADLRRMHVPPDLNPEDREAVARHYIESWSPGGVYFTYFKHSNFVGDPEVGGHDRIFVHGGLTDQNITRVPTVTNAPKDMVEWRDMWRERGAELIAKAEHNLERGLPIDSDLADLINSRWQNTTHENLDQGLSTIYVSPPHEGKNYRAPTPEVAARLREVGIEWVHSGHKPQGAQGRVLPTADGRTIAAMHDGSYSQDAEQISAAAGRSTMVVARVGPDIVATFKAPRDESPFGMVTNDGFTVDGVVLIGEHRGQYRLSKYDDHFRVIERFVDEAGLIDLQPRAVDGRADMVAEDLAERWAQMLATAGKHRPELRERFDQTEPVPLVDLYEQLPKGGSVVTVHAPSRFGQIARGATEVDIAERIQRAMANITGTYGDELVAIHGGTHTTRTVDGRDFAAPESELMEAMAKRGEGIGVGIVPPQVDADWLVDTGPGKNSLRYLSAAGAHNEDWAAPAIAAGVLADQAQGVRLFLGGSTGLVEPLKVALETSREQLEQGERPALVFVLKSDTPSTGPQDVNASDEVARQADLPPNFVPITVEQLDTIGELMKSLNQQYRAAPLEAVRSGHWRA